MHEADKSPRTSAASGGLPLWLRGTRPGAALARKVASRLIARRRFDEADALLSASLALRPLDPRLLSAHAMSAHNRGLFQEAVARWTRARERGAAEPFAAACLAANLRELSRHDEAQALIDEALARHPDDLMAVTEAARLARDRHRPGDATALWRRAIQLANPHPDWLQGYAQGLFALGDLGGAAGAVRSARRQFPAHRGLLAVEGALLVAQEEWQAALAFWTDYRRRFPDDATGWEQLGIASQGLAMSGTADAASSLEKHTTAAPPLADIAIIEDEPMRRLVMRFESIGDSCELGLVQRRFGAEPLGLLRWNDVALGNLIAALEQRFEGMGEPANTELATAVNGEFFVVDRRWALGMHTFLFAGHVDADDVFRRMCRRIVYLRGKLIEDLESAKKIFVYCSSALDVAGLRRLHHALGAYGPVTLLGVQPITEGLTAFPRESGGGIERLDDRLYVGFLGRSGIDARGAWDIAFDDWTSIFAKTLEATLRSNT